MSKNSSLLAFIHKLLFFRMTRMKHTIVVIVLLIATTISCPAYANRDKRVAYIYNSADLLFASQHNKTVFLVKGNVNLDGLSVVLPISSSIVLEKGGIRNGVLIGNDTKLEVKN